MAKKKKKVKGRRNYPEHLAPFKIKKRTTLFGNFITRARINAGYSMAKIAKAVPCTKQLISQVETGVNLPSHRVVLRLSHLYGINEATARKVLAKQESAKARNKYGYK